MPIVFICFLPRLMKTDLKGIKEGGQCSIFRAERDKPVKILTYWQPHKKKNPNQVACLKNSIFVAWSVIHLAYCQPKQNINVFKET